MTGSAPARFIVGTGRCGSTLLSRMLATNTRLLNVFELFSGIPQEFRFRPGPVDGAVLAARLRLDHPMLTMVMKRGGEVPEVVYPFADPTSRYALGDPVPWALAIAIPRISDAPDRLFDELMTYVESRGEAALSVHYRAIFDWLVERTGKAGWIERSGTSIDTLGELHQMFPDARFVHIHRDGREAALSMREYAVLRVAVAVMNGLAGEIEYTHEGLTALERSRPGRIDELLAARPPIELYGAYWREQIERGYAARARLDPAIVLDLRFEDLVTEPRQVLGAISEFFELPASPGWLERAAKLSRGMPRLRLPELAADERSRLEAACDGAMQLIGRGS